MGSINFDIHKIFVEGITDQACIEKILELKYGISFPHNGIAADKAIINCGGWNKLKTSLFLIDEYRKDMGGKNLVIFDADGKNNEGGYQKRYNQLMSVAGELNIKFEIFLFPNNSADGILEDFYCSCFKKEMKFFEDCWQGMLLCFEQNNNFDLKLNSPSVYDKVYSYVDLFEEYKTVEYKNTKTKRHYFDMGIWEFDFEHNDNLQKLISFIEDCGIVTNE